MRAPAAAALLGLWLSGCTGAPLRQGVEAFQAGDLDGAIAPWQAVAQEGTASGRVQFDLGNAWYRKGDLPRALAHYRAAQQLRPRDGNVHHNLALARSELEGRMDPVGPAPSWSSLVTPTELGALGVALVTAGSGLAVAWRRRGRAVSTPAALCWIAGAALSAVAASGAYEVREHPVAVTVEEASARDLPRPDAEVRFSLSPGAEVRVNQRAAGFALIEDGRGRRGWVSTSAIYTGGRPL